MCSIGRVIQILSLLTLSFVAGASFGQVLGEGPPYGYGFTISRNKSLNVRLLTFAEAGKKVSGTNENFTAEVDVTDALNPPPFSGNPWEAGFIKYMRIEIGTGSDKTVYEWSDEQSSLTSKVIPVRWATTHFQDGATVPIVLTARARMQTSAPEYVTVEAAVTVQVLITNKVLQYATVMLPGNPAPDPVSVAKDAVIMAGPKWTSDFLHTRLLADYAAESDTHEMSGAARLDQLLKQATVFFAFTHGTTLGIHSSVGHPTIVDPNEFVDWTELGTYVSTNRTIPDYNLAIVYSCQTLETYLYGPKKFKVYQDSPNQPPDRAYVGFAEEVDFNLLKKIGGTLDLHAKCVLEQLAAGVTLFDAVRKANQYFTPSISGNPEAPALALIKGDPLMRLINVYLTQSEQDWLKSNNREGDINKWYYIP